MRRQKEYSPGDPGRSFLQFKIMFQYHDNMNSKLSVVNSLIKITMYIVHTTEQNTTINKLLIKIESRKILSPVKKCEEGGKFLKIE